MSYILNFYTLHSFYSSSMIYGLTMMLIFGCFMFAIGISCHSCCSCCSLYHCIPFVCFFYLSTRISRLLIVVFLLFRSFIIQALFLFATFYASSSEMWIPLEQPWGIKDAADLHAVIFSMDNQISEDEAFADLLTFFNAIFFFMLLHSTLKG